MNRLLINKKIPIIPPILFEGKLISDFEKKTDFFNNRFASQCSLVKNESTLPNLEYKTNERLSYFEINENYILSIIKNLNASKTHGWAKISARMIKLCGSYSIKTNISTNSSRKVCFPMTGKNAL